MKTNHTANSGPLGFFTKQQAAFPRWLAIVLLALPAQAQDVGFVSVIKGQRFIQKNPDFVSLGELAQNADPNPAEVPLFFEAVAMGTAADSLKTAEVQIPEAGTAPLVREDAGNPDLRREDSSGSLLALNSTRPDGRYTVNVVTKNDVSRSFSLDLVGGNYPPVPQITNYPALQAITASNATTVQWSPMGGTAQDFILCQVSDDVADETVYESGMPGDSGALDGTATQTVIPSYVLQPGRTYRAELLFVRTVDVEMTDVMAVAGYSKITSFNVATSPLPASATGAGFAYSIPSSDAQDVQRDAAVAFHFSAPMAAAHAVTWTVNGAPSSQFSYEWIDGNKVLLCRFDTPGKVFPANAEIAWTLNLSGFSDVANFPLSGSKSGSFHTSSDDPASPPDAEWIYAIKQHEFFQNGSAPVDSGIWDCELGVDLNAFNRVKTATLTVAGKTGNLEHHLWNESMNLEGDFASPADLDRFFPNGDFAFALDTLDDGPRNVTLSLGSTDVYPAAPTVTNLAALQAIDPASPVTIHWDPLAGWNGEMSVGSGLIELEIENTSGSEVVWAENPDLSNGGTEYTVPVGKLWPGRTYRVRLHFIRITDLDLSTYPNVFAAAGFQSTTAFTIRTTGTPVMPALTLQRINSNMEIRAEGGEPRREYVLESSAELGRWLPQKDLWIGEFSNSYTDQDAHYLNQRFYRLRDRAERDLVLRHVTIQGTVWTDSAHATPLAGATVGTNLDGRTALTDGSGRFFLETDTKANYAATPYTITVTSGGQTKNFGPFTWGDQPREQHFNLD